MTQNQAIRAYISAMDLNRQKMNNCQTAIKIYQLLEKLRPYWDFQLQEEEKIYSAHPDYDPQTSSCALKEETDEEIERCSAEVKAVSAALKELSVIEVDDIDFEPIRIDTSKESLKISGEDIGNLKGFVIFE